MKKLLFIALTIMTFASCSKSDSGGSNSTPSPTVDFSYSGANVAAPATVSFSSSVTNTTSYLWDFGDNSSSTSANPTHTYTAGGVYTVKLTATGAGGSNSITKTVNVAAALTRCTITKVTLLQIPSTKQDGSVWDIGLTAFQYPDIYFNVTDSVNAIKYNNSSNIKSDVTNSMLPQIWTLSPTYTIPLASFNSLRFFDFYDDDATNDDYIGYVGFKLTNYIYNTSTPYPSSITVTRNISTSTALVRNISVRFDVTWQ